MTTLTRWEPFRELATLRNVMDRLMDDPFEFPLAWSRGMTEFRPAVDMTESEDAFTIKASLPGVDPKDVEVSLTDNVVTIKGEMKEEKKTEEANYHLHERRYGSFMRSFALPMAVKADKVEATNEHGVLTLNLPKSETVKPKKITVKTIGNGDGKTK